MTCDETEILLHALVDGELDAFHAREVEAHIATCAKCAAAMRDYREIFVELLREEQPSLKAAAAE